jgi:hypothetical protein
MATIYKEFIVEADQRQPDVVLRQRRRSRARVHQVVQLRLLHPLAEAFGVREAVHQAREPPREALRLPDPAQAALRIGVDAGVALFLEVLDQRARQVLHVGRRQVQALGAGRRHDVGGVAGQEQAAEAHRLGDEAAQRRDALLDAGAGDHRSRQLRVEPAPQLVPEALVAPVFHLVVDRALHVVAAARHAAHGAQREAALAVAVDDGVRRHRRHVGQHAQPAEGVDLLELL